MAARVPSLFSRQLAARRCVSASPITAAVRPTRSFQTAMRRFDAATATVPPSVSVQKPVGAFRGGLLGFFAGGFFAGAAVYYYILDEYKVSNELITEDIYVRLCI